MHGYMHNIHSIELGQQPFAGDGVRGGGEGREEGRQKQANQKKLCKIEKFHLHLQNVFIYILEVEHWSKNRQKTM